MRLSDILLNSNEPDFKMFFEFGCHEVDSIFTMVCYDWDPNQPVGPLRGNQMSGAPRHRRVVDFHPALDPRGSDLEVGAGKRHFVLSLRNFAARLALDVI